jgi:polysaccharide export outer membrane protein
MRYVLVILAMLLGLVSSAVAQSYRFQSGDLLQVSVWQEPKLDRQVVVAPDGSIALPLAGRIVAGGRTSTQVEESIRTRLSSKYQGDIDVTVSFVRHEPKERVAAPPPEERVDPTIYVMGEVQKPGQFVIKTRTTVLQALALGGGLSPFAAQRRIQVHRKVDGVDTVFDFDYRAFERGQDVDGNIVLRPGDVVVVPERGLFE